MSGFKDSLTPNNYQTLIGTLTSQVAQQFEKVILKTNFNRVKSILFCNHISVQHFHVISICLKILVRCSTAGQRSPSFSDIFKHRNYMDDSRSPHSTHTDSNSVKFGKFNRNNGILGSKCQFHYMEVNTTRSATDFDAKVDCQLQKINGDFHQLVFFHFRTDFRVEDVKRLKL